MRERILFWFAARVTHTLAIFLFYSLHSAHVYTLAHTHIQTQNDLAIFGVDYMGETMRFARSVRVE